MLVAFNISVSVRNEQPMFSSILFIYKVSFSKGVKMVEKYNIGKYSCGP